MAKAVKKAPSKTEILGNIATAAGLNKKDVSKVLEALSAEIKKSLSARGPGLFAIPGLVKIERKKVPARPAAEGRREPLHRRVARSARQARLGQSEGSRAEEPQGHGGLSPDRASLQKTLAR